MTETQTDIVYRLPSYILTHPRHLTFLTKYHDGQVVCYMYGNSTVQIRQW